MQNNQPLLQFKFTKENTNGLFKYYAEMEQALIDVNDALKPYSDTISNAEAQLIATRGQIAILSESLDDLIAKEQDLLTSIDELVESEEAVNASHMQACAALNKTFLKMLVDQHPTTTPLLDSTRAWSVDLNYIHSFGELYISEVIPNESEPSEEDDTFSDLSDYMGSVDDET